MGYVELEDTRIEWLTLVHPTAIFIFRVSRGGATDEVYIAMGQWTKSELFRDLRVKKFKKYNCYNGLVLWKYCLY